MEVLGSEKEMYHVNFEFSKILILIKGHILPLFMLIGLCQRINKISYLVQVQDQEITVTCG